jgi:MYXO-CTERM domain-containing protein
VPALEGFQQAMERATQGDLMTRAREAEQFAAKNDAEMAANLARIPEPGRAAGKVQGYLMEQNDRSSQTSDVQTSSDSQTGELAVLWASVPALALLLAWRWRRRRGTH